MQILRFALRNLWRDMKSGELSVLLLALTIAVLSLTAVGFFTSRITQAGGVNAHFAGLSESGTGRRFADRQDTFLSNRHIQW